MPVIPSMRRAVFSTDAFVFNPAPINPSSVDVAGTTCLLGRTGTCYIDNANGSDDASSTAKPERALKIERYKDSSDLGQRLYDNAIKVEFMEEDKAESPDVLRSGGLGPCIAIGVYDPLTKAGYMAHHQCFSEADLASFNRWVQSDCEDLARLHVVAVGAGYADDEEPDIQYITTASRALVESTIKTFYAGAQIFIEWTPDDKTNELILNTLTGTFGLYITEETFQTE